MDEPNASLDTNQGQASFVDLVMCGSTTEGAFAWSRSGSPSKSSYAQPAEMDIETAQKLVCGAISCRDDIPQSVKDSVNCH
jgi:hypothetical protein